MRIAILALMICWIAATAAARTGSGHYVPTYNNFCGKDEMTIPVTVCNDMDEFQIISLGANSGGFPDCNATFEPAWTKSPAGYGLLPGQCATFELTIQRPDILDSEPEACFWVTIQENPGPAVWLGIYVVDTAALSNCLNWHFYEAEWNRFIHPLDPVTQQIDIRNMLDEVQDMEYELRIRDENGEEVMNAFSLNNQEAGMPLQGFAYLEPLGTTEIGFELMLLDPDLSGPFEMVLLSDTDWDGEPNELGSMAIFNAEVRQEGGEPMSSTSAPQLLNVSMGLALSPNPFNPSTEISFELAADAVANVAVLDLRGRVVRRLLDGQKLSAGTHRLRWNGLDDRGGNVASGIYHVRVEAGGRTEIRKATLLK